jgi:toxin ParE1/3/4
MPYRLAARAEADLYEIWSYIEAESGSREIADRLVDSITGLFLTLAANPQMGRPRLDLRQGLRSFAARSYVVFYRVEDSIVVVMRVLHGRRDMQSLLGE